MVLVKFNIPG